MPITDPELLVITRSFQIFARSAFKNAANEEAQAQVVQLLNEAMRDYTRQWRVESEMGCPDGWVACPDGSCVPDGSSCGVPMSFQAVTAYIAEAAEFYFGSASTEALQSRTRELLQKARQTFESRVILEVLEPQEEIVAAENS